MHQQSSPAPATLRACQSDTEDGPVCPSRRMALARTLALGAAALIDTEAMAAGTGKWYPVSTAKGFALNRPRLVRFLNGQAAVFIVKVKANNTFVCLWAGCTHDGVELTWNPSHPTIYHCRKHGAEFARNTGQVTHGPAKQNLPKLPIRVVKNVVQVDLSPTGLV